MVDCFEVGKLKNRIIMVCRWQIDFSGLKKGMEVRWCLNGIDGIKNVLKGNHSAMIGFLINPNAHEAGAYCFHEFISCYLLIGWGHLYMSRLKRWHWNIIWGRLQ